MSSSTTTGSPAGCTPPDSSTPNTGSATLICTCLARDVRPSLAPMTRSPAATRRAHPFGLDGVAVLQGEVRVGCRSAGGWRRGRATAASRRSALRRRRCSAAALPAVRRQRRGDLDDLVLLAAHQLLPAALEQDVGPAHVVALGGPVGVLEEAASRRRRSP